MTTQSAGFKLLSTTLWVVAICIGGIVVSDAWSLMPGSLSPRLTNSHLDSFSRLASSKDKDTETTACAVRRLGLTGVSVSEGGFAVLWGLSNTKHEKVYWPWYVTTPQAGDKKAVTSAQALTLCQLIASIDLAGSRFPADILAQVTVLSCEQEQQTTSETKNFSTAADPSNDLTAERLARDLQRQVQSIQRQWFPKEAAASSKALSYTAAPGWIRARVRLPLCTLDQIIVEPTDNGLFQVSLHVQVRDYGRLVVKHVTDTVLEDVFGPLYDDFTFSDETRRSFLTTALSLRYKAPVLLELSARKDETDYDDLFLDNVTQVFPLYRTVAKVQTPSDRVVSQIEKSWEVHQLQAAYQIAIKKKDMKAVAKIRAKLDEMEEMSELPVQSDSELDSMQ